MTREDALRRKTIAEAELAIARHNLHQAQSHARRTGRRLPREEYDALFDAVRRAERVALAAIREYAEHPKPQRLININDYFRAAAQQLLRPELYHRILDAAEIEHDTACYLSS